MIHPELYSLHDIWTFFLAFCAAIITITGAIGAVIKWVNKAKEPTAKIITRIDGHDKVLAAHDERLEEINKFLANDKETIEEIKESNRIIQKALLGIMEQLISGDTQMESLKEAKDELQMYLISK